jgi:hypothetical protein
MCLDLYDLVRRPPRAVRTGPGIVREEPSGVREELRGSLSSIYIYLGGGGPKEACRRPIHPKSPKPKTGDLQKDD